MREIQGKYTSAKIFTDSIGDSTIDQIRWLINYPVLAGSRVRIMPDVHYGSFSPIGFTATVSDKIMPSIVGTDIGCGVTIAKIKARNLEFHMLDTVIRKCVPSGFSIYSPSIGKDTLDEAPFAYRGIGEIIMAITDTVMVENILKPVYNFKAGGDD